MSPIEGLFSIDELREKGVEGEGRRIFRFVSRLLQNQYNYIIERVVTTSAAYLCTCVVSRSLLVPWCLGVGSVESATIVGHDLYEALLAARSGRPGRR